MNRAARLAWDGDAIPFFGMDVENWKPGQRMAFDAEVDGFPTRSLDDLPAGEYTVQAVLNRYEKFTRSDGRTLWLPPDQGEGQVWHRKPGNLHSKPVTVRIDGKRSARASSSCSTRRSRRSAPFEDKQTEYVRYFRMRSERLSKFWGRDVYLAAWVRLPWGYHEHPDARYPLVIAHGHFPAEPWRIPRDAAGSGSEAGLQQAVPARGLQPHPAGVRMAGASRLDHAGFPARAAGRDPASRRLSTMTPTP